MIWVCDLSFSYKEHRVLKGISFEIQPGTVNFLLGANGAGKTTLFRCMLGVLPGYSGRILLEGKNIRDSSAIEMAERMAYIPQAHSSIFAYTVIDVVLMGLNRRLSLFLFREKGERNRYAGA